MLKNFPCIFQLGEYIYVMIPLSGLPFIGSPGTCSQFSICVTFVLDLSNGVNNQQYTALEKQLENLESLQLFYQPISCHWLFSIPPENRKTGFQGLQKEASGMKWVNNEHPHPKLFTSFRDWIDASNFSICSKAFKTCSLIVFCSKQ